MNPIQYDRVAICVIADQLEAEAPHSTVSAKLCVKGWTDLVATIQTVYPAAFLTMCARHQREIEEALTSGRFAEREEDVFTQELACPDWSD